MNKERRKIRDEAKHKMRTLRGMVVSVQKQMEEMHIGESELLEAIEAFVNTDRYQKVDANVDILTDMVADIEDVLEIIDRILEGLGEID